MASRRYRWATGATYSALVARGTVKFWKAVKGWGAISSDELPPGR
ncbi:MAG: hypothetical protein JWN31_1132, partial [Frankiales bacterium]|nr:hypothetical protein [Frankiales bacterium]